MKRTSLMVIHMKYGLSDACHMFFSTLSTPSRLGILELLRGSPKNVTQLAESLKQEQSMISHNLKPLTRCGFIFVKKSGKNRIYSLNKETMEPMYKIIEEHMKKYCTKGECLEHLRKWEKERR